MKKLISMTDFVLEQIQNSKYEEFHQVNETFVNKVCAYANFLKQPLELWMFVPCDEDGNVLEEPQLKTIRNSFDEIVEDYDYDECEVYRQAKDKVLFVGFSVQDKGNFYFIEKEKSCIYTRVLKNKSKLRIEDLLKNYLDISSPRFFPFYLAEKKILKKL